MTSLENKAKDRLVLALDIDTKEEAFELVSELHEYVGIFKVGLQIITSEGPEIVKCIQEKGCKLFFDGKFHDIPNTIAKASANVTRLGADIFDVHVAGGSKMIKAAVKESVKVAEKYNIPKPTILGITVLSSIDQTLLTEELAVPEQIDAHVTRLALLAKESGLDGVVASVKEVEQIRKACGKDFLIMCPGIRPTWAEVNDQKRIATPAEAIRLGADLLVVGRPITAAENRVNAAKKILSEIQESLNTTLLLCEK